MVSRGRIVCWDRRRNIVYDEPAVLEKYGVAPHTIPDWLALVGDAADGIPGVPAWGAKSAATVLSKYQHLEAIPAELENWEVTVRGARRLHESFMTHQEEAFLYRRLTRLRDDVPLTDTLDEFNVAGATKRFRPAMSRIGSERPSCASAFKRLSRKIDMRYALKIRPLSPADRDWATRHVAEHWGAEIVVAHGTIYHPAALPGFVAELDGKVTGLVTFQISGDACEIVTLDSLHPGQGIGTALIEEVKAAAGAAGCRRLWLITTNDNLHALGFYQKRGFRLVAVHPGAVDAARKLKPEIPLIGNDGIPIRDEIELEIVLT